jgi:outer membrane protein assembly factor BamB
MKRVGLRSRENRWFRLAIVVGWACAALGQSDALAQGRGGGGTWTTAAGDAQRTSSVKNDPKITSESVVKDFKLLWKTRLSVSPGGKDALTQPVLLPNIISFKGFKALAFVGGSGNNVYAVDYDLSRLFWSRHLTTAEATPAAASAVCPGGLTTITRATPLAAQVSTGRGGRGAPSGRGAPPAGPPMPGSGPGPNAVLGGIGGRGGNNNVYAITSDGKLHALNAQDGTDMVPPIAFLPANAKAVGSILIDTALYAATTDSCGGSPDALWKIELANDANTVTSWQAHAPIAGEGPAFGPDGTIYLATGAGQPSSSGSIVALDPNTLQVRATFKPEHPAPFSSSPVVVEASGKTFVAAGTSDGRVYVLDGAATLVSSTEAVPGSKSAVTGLATWQQDRVTWVGASVSSTPKGSVVAFKLADEGGKPTLTRAWASRDLAGPAMPLVVNSVVFALSTKSKPATLSALDGATGKEVWNSGTAITTPVRAVGPAGGDSQVYVVTSDGTLYAFGIPMER